MVNCHLFFSSFSFVYDHAQARILSCATRSESPPSVSHFSRKTRISSSDKIKPSAARAHPMSSSMARRKTASRAAVIKTRPTISFCIVLRFLAPELLRLYCTSIPPRLPTRTKARPAQRQDALFNKSRAATPLMGVKNVALPSLARLQERGSAAAIGVGRIIAPLPNLGAGQWVARWRLE